MLYRMESSCDKSSQTDLKNYFAARKTQFSANMHNQSGKLSVVKMIKRRLHYECSSHTKLTQLVKISILGFRFQVYNSLPYVYMLIGCVRCRERNKWIERTVLMRKGKR